MINKIGLEIDKKRNFSLSNNNKIQVNKNYNSNPTVSAFPAGLNYFVPFLGNATPNKDKWSDIQFNLDSPAKKLTKALEIEAKESGYDEITTLHVLRHSLVELQNYMNDLDSGKKNYNEDLIPPMASVLNFDIYSGVLSKPKERKKLAEPLDVNIKFLDLLLDDMRPEKSNSKAKVEFSEDLIDAIWSFRQDAKTPISPMTILSGVVNFGDEDTLEIVDKMIFDFQNAIMLNDTPIAERNPFSEYEHKAENVLKNLALGTNIFLTYDSSKENASNFLDTLRKVHEQKGDDKTLIFELNNAVNASYFLDLVTNISNDKEHDYILALNPTIMAVNTPPPEGVELAANQLFMPPDLLEILRNQPSNIKFLFYDAKVNFYNIMDPTLSSYSEYDEVSLPTLSSKQKIKSFKECKNLIASVQKPFTKNALEKVVEASMQLDGIFPAKTVNLMNKIARYYIDKKEINDRDVDNYLKEAVNMFKKETNDSSVEVVFDTGKRLKDLVGKESTKKEALSLVKQIKSNKMGTKGVVIYSQDGSPGSGRRFTAKAIAGEARVPYVEVNTMDFGTKDVDLFGGGALSPEASIKKLFSMVTAQAEANPNKSAVLFVENFEYFSVGELVSFYHQKAMAQLLREMEKANNAGLNILVVGSVADPRLIGEATMKSFKFVDKVEVSSPAFNKDERAQVIARSLKDLKLKVVNAENVVKYVADITAYSSFIELKNLVKKAQSVALERGHKALTKADFTEAYLQLTTGRPSASKNEPHEKQVVASHECGHATNLEVMNNVAKTLGKPWHIPQKVNFITLDPRGWFGGAVYHGRDINCEMSFENIFADIVCAFGGNSAEKTFFGMDGSWGITGDMENARYCAEKMVKVMGLGVKTGKMAIDDYDNLSDNMKQMIEDDERVILNNAKLTSEMITEVYSDFNEWFTKKYAPLVGTGDCIMDGDEFRKALSEWKSAQSPKKQKELQLCDETIIKIMDATKKGIAIRKA